MDQFKCETNGVFDVTKICRTCLSSKDEMRSIFVSDVSTGNALILAEMITGISSIEINHGDGLPALICLQCVHQISRAYSFKQLCEQSDTNLRQYLGLPRINSTKKDISNTLSTPSHNNYSNNHTNNYKFDTTSDEDDSSDEFDDLNYISTVDTAKSHDQLDEKTIAQRQLLKAAKAAQKSKLSKRKLKAAISKNPSSSNSALLVKKLKRTTNQCNVCRKQFINLKSFRKHLRTHIEDRPFKCKLCSRGFTEENYLNNHMRIHVPDDQKPHQCKVCLKRFIHITLLNRHMLKHNGEKPFICKICNKGCYAENSLLKHMKIHEKKEGDPALLKHICDYCKTEFTDAETLSVHIKQHTGDRPFVCNMCGKCFPQRFNLELHLRTHTGERPFQCEVCKNGYVSKASLKIHMRTHTNERPFRCDFCGKAFRQSGDLTSHKRLHGTEKPIECDICQKRFTTVMKLKYHTRNHTGERPYVCTICGRGFTVNTILLRHMRVHSGERPYVCVTCGKAFSQSSTLNTHMKVHTTPNSRYNCSNSTERQSAEISAPAKCFPVTNHPTDPSSLPLTDNTLIQHSISDPNRLLSTDHPPPTHLMSDNHRVNNETSRLMLNMGPSTGVTSGDASRLLTNHHHDHSRLMTSSTSSRILNESVINGGGNPHHHHGLLTNDTNSRHLSVLESTRILTDKYLSTYDPYHRGHL